jgi:CO/xanthine dehydrogenase FAD-binding subunit
MPMMNFRLVNPAIVLDINRIAGLDRISADADGLTFGALVRHRMTATDKSVAAEFPVLAQAMTHVAHHTIRNRGTFVGSLCHADPAAEMPMLALLLDAGIAIASVRGMRHVAARDFFVGPLFTALEPDEMVTGVTLPRLAPGTLWGFEEFARRPGDFALAAVAVTMSREGERAKDVRITMMGVADTPVRLPAAESVLESDGFARLDTCIDAVRDALEPNTDLHASRDYRLHLAGVLAGRAIAAAWHRGGNRNHD